MPDEKTAVSAATATADKGVRGTGSPTAEELLANAKAENERKTTELSSLKQEFAEMKDRYEELDEKIRLTAQEREEKSQIKSEMGDLKDQISQLRLKPENKAFFAHLDESIKAAKDEGMTLGAQQALVILQQNYLKKVAREEKLDYKKLVDSVRPFSSKYDSEDPLTKAEMGVSDWREFQKFQKEKEDFALEKAKLGLSGEDGRRKPRETTLEEAVASKDIQAQKRALGL